MKSAALAKKIAALTLTKKADGVVIMDLRPLTAMTDFFVVCSADSDTQVKAIADAVEDGMEKKGSSPWHREAGGANWVLLDYVDVVLHVFHKTARSYYNLEKLWGDAEMTYLADQDAPSVSKPRVRKTAGKPVARKRPPRKSTA